MPARKGAEKGVPKPASGFTADEIAAMKEHAQELRRRSRAAPADGERDVLAKIASMQVSDRVMAERLHAIVRTHAPSLTSRTWYGMPAYVKDGEILCFFQPAEKFKTRYATFGFSDEAKLDEGHMWPSVYALTKLESAEEARIVTLLKRAMG